MLIDFILRHYMTSGKSAYILYPSAIEEQSTGVFKNGAHPTGTPSVRCRLSHWITLNLAT